MKWSVFKSFISDNTSYTLDAGGAGAEHGPDVHIKPAQHQAKEDNDGEELRDKAQDIPNIKNNAINNIEKDLEKEEVIILQKSKLMLRCFFAGAHWQCYSCVYEKV